MKTRTITRAAVLLSSAALLAACGGGGGSSPSNDASEGKRQSLLYAYPYNEQTEIATAAPVVLRFTSDVTIANAENAVTLHEGDADGAVVDVDYSKVEEDQRGLVLTPKEHLKPLTDYTVVVNGLELDKGTSANKNLTFTTRPLQKGPKELVVTSDEFAIERQIPDASKKTEPVMDFSTFRFQFSQPIDPTTAHYGDAPASSTAPADTIKLTDANGDVVDATLLIDGPYMTVDPTPEYLNAGETYTLSISGELASTYGENFAAQEFTYQPMDSSPRGEPAILVQKLTTQGTSRLTGAPINQVPVNGTLLGEGANFTQARSDAVEAELGDVTVYTDVTPLRIPRGTTLNGDAIEKVLIGGKVDAGFGSGDVKMVFLSDATGYLVPNPYNSVRSDALRIVHLFMDVGIATEDPRANGSFTQDIAHIELVGVADVDTTAGTLNIDAVSVVEPDILGQEYGYGVLSFQLQSYADQENPPAVVMEDVTPPELQSWMPQNREPDGVALYQKPGDPLVLNFNEPIDGRSLRAAFILYKNGSEVGFDYELDGASVLIRPSEPLTYSKETDPVSYQLQISDQITDVAGNHFNGQIVDFSMPTEVEIVAAGINASFQPEQMIVRAPIVSAIYPGFPCVTDPATRDLANGISGRCIGSVDEPIVDGDSDANIAQSDALPVTEMPRNRPIIVNFSKDMDIDSIVLGQSFLVEKSDEAGNAVEEVAGDLRVEPRRVVFYPDEPWEEGALYRSTLKSNGNMTSSACDPSGQICSFDGLPLQTQMLGRLIRITNSSTSQAPTTLSTIIPAPNGGGQDMVNFFVGAEETDWVFQNLNNLPTSDTNSNFFHDANRTVEEPPNPIVPYIVEREYNVEEYGATDEPDPNADLTPSVTNGVPIDLNGVLPPMNAVKVLSRNTAGLDFQGQASNPSTLALNSVNVGCGFQDHIPFDADNPVSYYAVPLNCPKQKFIYLSGNLNADVTDEYDEDQDAMKVLIWPGQITATSLTAYTRLSDTEAYVPSDSGPQVMRMRYEEDENGIRNQPITGWIRNTVSGPVLDATVDLYVDIPELQYNLFALSGQHNMHSHPITLSLTGDIDFMDDGRMVIEQINTNLVDLDVRIYASGRVKGSMDLRVAAEGTRINYISQPIKN
ncbi:Ig-like domain-containing protein [Alloalcanivorax mobilis]|uniref:Ig-like domain-containing protein n=1 Tax=Alloalcanivorax mobilis TaxID=2019569 RepID=UPI000C78B8AA|nr:Ig-like domain-containing protein [Alloalcanivorax mobilis]